MKRDPGKKTDTATERWNIGSAKGDGALQLNQDEIQKRMTYACKLLDLKRNGVATPALATWYHNVALNGLCGGWVTIHRNAPTWIEPVWEALVAWEPDGTLAAPVAGDLGSLQTELKALGVGDVGSEVDEVVRALTTAWEVMNRLEPTAGYGQAPEWLRKTAGAPAVYESTTPEKTVKLDCTVGNAGTKLAKTVLDYVNFGNRQTAKHYYAHIETDHHHMGVRLKFDKTDFHVAISETEVAGIITCTTKAQLEAVLYGGSVIGNQVMATGGVDKEATDAVEVELEVRFYALS